MSLRRLSRVALLATSVAALAAPVAADATTTGSVTLSLTKPIVATATRSAPVACTVSGSAYRASVTSSIRNYQVRVSDVVLDYTGTGSYTSTAHVTVRYLPTGSVATASRQATVQIDAAGETGTVPFAVTFPGSRVHRLAGRSTAGSLSWTCAS